MSTAYSSLVAQMRVRLEEAVARKWSDADQLIPYGSRAEQRLAQILSRIPKSRRFRVIHESATIAANATTFDLTTLTSASTKPFDWLIAVSCLVGNLEVPLVNFEDGDQPYLRNMSLGGGAPISKIDLQDDNLVILPAYGSARTFYFDYGWLPVTKTSSSDVLQTPTKYDGYVVEWALHFALADAGLSNSKFEEELAADRNEIEDLERSRRGISNERVLQRARTFSRCR